MITAILAGALALALPQQQTDTTFEVRAGGHLEIDALNGSVTIDTWDRAAMRVRSTASGATRVEIERNGSRVSIDSDNPRGRPGPVRLEITVPRRFDIQIEGVHMPIVVDGVQGSLDLENVEGSITVRRVSGPVNVESVSGGIILEDVQGDVTVTNVNEALHLSSVRGNISAETTNGAIVMRGIESTSVEASTVNGLVEYHGTVRDGGNYYLGTHNGRITMSMPAGANARLDIATRNGKVEAAFPVQVRSEGDGEFSISLGSGSARIELESYNGSVYLVRPSGR
ncbi:MAG TPA: DUF4097 family beta strand repeat-containing protein [Longimicrobiales bacterium]